MDKKARTANLHASALRRELDRMSKQAQHAEALAERAQLAMTARNWADAITLFETALRELTQHPATLSPTASAEPDTAGEATLKQSGASDGPWYRVAMPALLRAGPSLSSRALERLEVGGVLQGLQPVIECEGRRRLQVAGQVYGRGWCSLETASGKPILREVPSAASHNQARPSPVATELPSNTGSSTPKQGWVHGLEQVDSSPLQSRAAESLSEEKDEAAAWRAEAVRREAAHAEEKVRKEEAEQEALQVAEKAAESARIAQLRSYKEQAKRLEESRRSPQNTAGRSTSAVSPPPTARTPSNSSAAAARYAAVEPSLSATRPRNRWESVHSASRVEEATAGGASSARKEEAVPVSARKAARAAQAEVGTRRSSWREVALRREAAMLGTNRRRRRRTDESRQLQHAESEDAAACDDDWRERVNRALNLAEEAAATSASDLTDSDFEGMSRQIPEALTPPRHARHEETSPQNLGAGVEEDGILRAGTRLQRSGVQAGEIVGTKNSDSVAHPPSSRSTVSETLEALKVEAQALATPELTGGKAAAFYSRFGGMIVAKPEPEPEPKPELKPEPEPEPESATHVAADDGDNGSQSLTDDEYQRELEALRKISADADASTREIAIRQANRHVTNPMHANHYSVAGLHSPWAASSHGAADE